MNPHLPLPNSLIALLDRFRKFMSPVPTGKYNTDVDSFIDCAMYKNGKRQDLSSLAEAYEAAQSIHGGFVWLALREPSLEELEEVATAFGLHPLAVEDAVHAHQRPKIEIYDDSLFFVIKTVTYVNREEVITPGEILVFIGHNYVISVCHGDHKPITDVRHHLDAQQHLLRLGPSAVVWAIADSVIDNYEEAITDLTTDIEEIETAVFETSNISPTERIYKLKREVLEFRRAVDPLDIALNPIVTGSIDLINPEIIPYFRDAHDHALRTGSRLESFDQLLSDVLQANVAQISLRQNEDMRRITAWAAILAVVTSIAGIYGMNFENMPELKWANGYYICLATMTVVSVGLYVLFRKRKWL